MPGSLMSSFYNGKNFRVEGPVSLAGQKVHVTSSGKRRKVMRDFAITMTHRPGELARVSRALSRYGVNLRSVAGLTLDGQGQVRFLPDDVDAARSALEASGIRFDEHEVVTALLENRAGELAGLADRLAEANVN